MTPDQLRQARVKLGLSTKGMAMALRLSRNGDRTVRRWESGDMKPSGPAIVAIQYMLMEKARNQNTA